MSPLAIYLLCLAGAVGLHLLMRPRGGRPSAVAASRTAGGLLAGGAVVWLVLSLILSAAEGTEGSPGVFTLLFALVAIVSAAQMILTARPVYAALHFVLVVIASAGMFLMLEAEFMAFALIIVYAGAILVTYMFVLMLAQQSSSSEDEAGNADYDRLAREPAAGAVVAFVLLALLSRSVFDGGATLESRQARMSDAQVAVEPWIGLAQMPGRIKNLVQAEIDEPFDLVLEEDGLPRMTVARDGQSADVTIQLEDSTLREVTLPDSAKPENIQAVGLALIAKFPASLEIAGVILLMAMFGAVILARRQIELTEDEKRAAAGLRRLGQYDEADEGTLPESGGGA